jgi:flagellar hook protein FlgE
MALTSTLFTGLSGLDVNQTKLNVVGNNIANVNTVAYKSSRALFKPQFYISEGGGSAPDGDFGGTNPNQRGLGAQVASIQKDFTQGAIEPTGKNTDLAIDGEGFFVVQDAGGQQFTRDGSFGLNAANQLTTTGGQFVQGYQVDSNFNIVPGRLGNVTIPLGALTSAKETSNAYFKGNLNAGGDVATGASILTSQPLEIVGGGSLQANGSDLLVNVGTSAGAATTAAFSVGQTFTLTGQKGERDVQPSTFVVTGTNTVGQLMDFFQQGMGVFPQGTGTGTVPDDGNAATPQPGWFIGGSAADPAGTTRLVLQGNLGEANKLSIPAAGFVDPSGATPLTFQDGDFGGITSDPAGESVRTSFVGYDSLGNPVTVNVTAVFESSSNSGNTWRFYAESPDDTDPSGILDSGTLTFDDSGKLIASTNTSVKVDRDNTGSGTPMSVNLDFSNMTSLASATSELLMTRQDGNAIGTLNDFSIGTDGKITGSFTNGQTRTLGQVAVATFTNPGGLNDEGGNMYKTGTNSGDPVIAAPMTLGSGGIRSGALEQSNVDLSEEFINMIVASTGFSAASRVITTSDQLITELLNSSR